jgi:hypothetical protein
MYYQIDQASTPARTVISGGHRWRPGSAKSPTAFCRLSTFVPDVAPPAGFTFNQFLVLGDEPLMFHTGLRKMFPLNRDALSRIVHPNACAGSPSATTRPTSAAR